MTNLEQNWTPKHTASIADKIGSSIHKEGPLKPRIEGATKNLSRPISKLDSMRNKLAEKDAKLFKRIVEAQQSHDMTKAKILANELSELRKNEKMVGTMRLSIEQVQMRLSTVGQLGDTMATLGPVMSTMKAMGPALAKFIPEADAEFTEMGNALEGLTSSSFEGSFENSTVSDEETDLILREASAVAGSQIGEKFPSVPSGTSSDISSTSATEQY